MSETTKYYAHREFLKKRGCETFTDVTLHPRTTAAYGGEGEVYEVTVRPVAEGEESVHWGWLDFEDGKYHMIWPSRVQAEVCFAYGYEAEEKRGRGKFLNLVVEAVSK